MLIYTKLIEVFEEALGPEYLLQYNNNEDFNWSEVLPENVAENVYGVLRQDSGEDRFIGDQTIKLDSMHISFAIPNAKEKFTRFVEKIEEIRDSLNNVVGELSQTQFFKILTGGRTDGVKERINGSDWVLTELYFQVQTYTSIYTSSNRIFEFKTGTVNNVDQYTSLKGILNTVYDLTKQFDSYVAGIDEPMARNKVNNIQKKFIVELVPSSDDTVLSSILTNQTSNDYWTLKYSDGIFTTTSAVYLAQVNEQCITGDIFKLQLTFVNI